jgi:D-alanyl-D-alanine dipeptidase
MNQKLTVKFIISVSLRFILIVSAFCCTTSPRGELDLVDLSTYNSRIVLDIRYATKNNYFQEILYPAPRCFVHRVVALKLDSIQTELEKQKLGLKVFDGYRPLSVTRRMWEILPDERYVANPQKGSRHNRGVAVDLTLIDSTGCELRMPTAFDDFSERAAHRYQNLPEDILKNGHGKIRIQGPGG